MNMDIIRHLADAIDALRKAYNCSDDDTAEVIQKAEFAAFEAMDLFIKSQVNLVMIKHEADE